MRSRKNRYPKRNIFFHDRGQSERYQASSSRGSHTNHISMQNNLLDHSLDVVYFEKIEYFEFILPKNRWISYETLCEFQKRHFYNKELFPLANSSCFYNSFYIIRLCKLNNIQYVIFHKDNGSAFSLKFWTDQQNNLYKLNFLWKCSH